MHFANCHVAASLMTIHRTRFTIRIHNQNIPFSFSFHNIFVCARISKKLMIRWRWKNGRWQCTPYKWLIAPMLPTSYNTNRNDVIRCTDRLHMTRGESIVKQCRIIICVDYKENSDDVSWSNYCYQPQSSKWHYICNYYISYACTMTILGMSKSIRKTIGCPSVSQTVRTAVDDLWRRRYRDVRVGVRANNTFAIRP